MYNCQFCSLDLFSVKAYLSHYKLHNNVRNIVFPCCYDFCNRTFVKFSSLKSHLTRDHGQLPHRDPQYTVQDRLLNDGFTCCIDSCKMKLDSLRDLIAHCKKHVSSDQPIPCPFLDCKLVFTKQTSFTSHISRKHKSSNYAFKQSFRQQNVVCSMFNSLETDVEESPCLEIDGNSKNSDLVSDNDQSLYGVFEESLALYYMKLEAVNLIPVSTIDSIMSDISNIHNLSIDLMFNKINNEVKFDTPEEKAKMSQIRQSDCLNTLSVDAGAIFNTNYKRKSYYKNFFNYVEPIELYLGLDENNKRCIYHYVPMKHTLKSLLTDSSVVKQINEPLNHEKHVYTDIIDGEGYKSNNYFSENNDALKLILYQDAFEIVNPLGSAKKTFKLIGFYFTLADIYPYNRGKIDPLQLTILCREKHFLYFNNGQVVLDRLISEIKELSKGVTIDGKFIKANLVCVLGDNLGSHFIGGFSTNFSSSQFYCRFCLMTKSDYLNNPVEIRNADLRTVENFNDSIKFIAENNLSQHNGIKFDSSLNAIEGFHVCNPALPPCLGHDLFEGVVRYDLALFINNLIVVKKWFDLKTLNFCIARFSYVGNDLHNKPVPIKAKCDNVGGHAVQNWTLLRLLPIIIYKHIVNPEDEVWKALELLRLITEYLCSPKLSINQVGIVQQHLDNYIVMRQTLFPSVNLRPKHHYLHHYPYLITQFGPLLRSWTMRFESKHTYFKKCIRSSKNFKNVTKTLSEKHQLLQSYYNRGSLFQLKAFDFDHAQDFVPSIVGSEVYDLIKDMVKNIMNAIFSKSVTIHGYSIKSGNCIVIDNSNGYIGFGQVQFFLNVDSVLKIVCKYKRVMRSFSGLYHVDFENGELVLLDSGDVIDLCPLHLYENLIALKSFPFEKWEK